MVEGAVNITIAAHPIMFSVYATSLLLIGLSGFMLDAHRRSWHTAQADGQLSERDLRFARSQYRRRTQASSIIGALGTAIAVGPLVAKAHTTWLMLIYLLSMIGACASITLLALLDVMATQQNVARLRSEQLAAQIKLTREMGRNEH
jgi:hypothetical protein